MTLERASRVNRLIGRPRKLRSIAKRQQQMFFCSESEATATNVILCESEATATNVFLCESEATATNVILCESEATATNVILCESEATATSVLSVRKRSDSNKCFICAKAKRQLQSAQPKRKSTTHYGDDPNFSNYKE